jgi:hypothetical protein
MVIATSTRVPCEQALSVLPVHADHCGLANIEPDEVAEDIGPAAFEVIVGIAQVDVSRRVVECPNNLHLDSGIGSGIGEIRGVDLDTVCKRRGTTGQRSREHHGADDR